MSRCYAVSCILNSIYTLSFLSCSKTKKHFKIYRSSPKITEEKELKKRADSVDAGYRTCLPLPAYHTWPVVVLVGPQPGRDTGGQDPWAAGPLMSASSLPPATSSTLPGIMRDRGEIKKNEN